MAETFEQLWNRVRLYAGNAPAPLCRDWINKRLAQIINREDDFWSFQVSTGNFTVNQSVFGTCDLTQYSTLVSNCVIKNGLAAVSVDTPGTGYNVGDILLVLPGAQSGSFGQIQVATLTGGPGTGVATATIYVAGANFKTINNVATAAYTGAGAGCTVDITALGNGAFPADRTQIVGRQAVFGATSPFFDIIDNQTQTGFQLSQPWPGRSQSGYGFEISNIYWTPSIPNNDLEKFVVFVDPKNSWRLWLDIHWEEINTVDAQRSSTGTPSVLCDLGWNDYYLSQLPNGVVDCFGQTNQSPGVARYEIWPRQQSDYIYTFSYKRRIQPLVNPGDTLPGFIRGDAVFEGALAELCAWPGTPPVAPNPKFSPVWMNVHNARFNQLLQEMMVQDHSIFERDYSTINAWLAYPWAPLPYALSSRFQQMHAPDLVYGGGWG